MNSPIIDKSQLNSTSNAVISTIPRKRGLVATWINVNGKLVCTWSAPSTHESPKSVEINHTACATVDKSEVQSTPLTVESTTSRKNRLIAQWLTVNGELVCKWITQELSPSSKLLKMSISQPKAA
ncbi:MAG: hypothetical protein HC862_20415 [Scytonema sp. RU_4_4]|nr:hypothetical protein [Scytonema sp. RU_4_4]